jgi:hypothetical protein
LADLCFFRLNWHCLSILSELQHSDFNTDLADAPELVTFVAHAVAAYHQLLSGIRKESRHNFRPVSDADLLAMSQ